MKKIYLYLASLVILAEDVVNSLSDEHDEFNEIIHPSLLPLH